MKHFFLFTAITCLFLAKTFAQQSDPFVRFPAINPDGTEIAFEYQGDIWKVPVSGGLAWRLTVHEGYDAFPKWSTDGSKIAFSGMRYGNYDVFLTPAKGGYPRQLTFHSANDLVSGFTPDGNIIFSTRRVFAQVEREYEVYEASPDGGTPYRIMDALGVEPEMSPNGKFIAFTMGTCKIQREDYRGPAQKDVWIYNTKNDKYARLTSSDGNDFMPHFAGNNSIFYISPKSGKYNIWKIEIDDEGKLVGESQITDYKDDGIRYFSIDKTGNKIVFEKQTNIYLKEISGGEAKIVNIEINPDYHFDPVEFKSFSDKISEYKISPNGKYAALVIRGEIFITATNDKNKTVSITDSPWRDRNVDWLNDSTLIFTSDRAGQYDIYIAKSNDENENDLFKTLKREIIRISDTPEDETEISVSPDGKKISYQSGLGKLFTAEISDKNKLINELELLDGWSEPNGTTWSPDSKWLAYSLVDLKGNNEIFVQAADGSNEPANISMHPRGDYSPFWSKDGSKLGFLSDRNNGDADVWFVWLKQSDWEKTNQDWEETEDDTSNKKDKKEKDVQPVKIDFFRIHERLEQVTGLPGNESDLVISDDGETFYFVINRNSRQSYKAENDLFSIKWNGKDLKQITTKNQKPYGVSLSPDGKYLFMLKSGGKLFKMDLKSDKQEAVNFAAHMKLDYEAEKEQIFEEAWRSLDQRFYDPDFHGKDWDALKKKYKPWAMKASNYFDFRDITNFMLGELNASHMDIRGGEERYQSNKISTGLLGIELKPLKNGAEVTRVVFNSPAHKSSSKINVGDEIVSVNGTKITESVNFWSLLSNQGGNQVLLEIKNNPGQIREIVIRPVESLNDALYDDWVEERRKLTDEYSGNRLGYLHIQGMNWQSFERFERDLAAAGEGKEGIVIDVRYNGGGWTTDYLMTVLNTPQHAYCVPRGAAKSLEKEHLNFRDDYPFGERLPYFAWTKPSIALCNESSYSNAEIFSHAYKTLDVGTLVGTPTFGAVISTGANDLLNGAYVRLPFRAWYVKATDENMEHGPAVPDIIVNNTPDSKAKGKDEQLQKAVQELLKEIENY
ncbi:MAG: PDZ domain-containing protein [Bacteroidales bacterium]|nr:PDZ domain-containing protein [Bacteroidales bacterium]